MVFLTMSGLALAILEPFFVAAFRVITDELEEKWNLVSLALRANALDEGVLDIVDARIVVGRVVDQNLHRVGAPIDDALGGDVRQKVGQAAGLGVVVSAEFVGQQQACVRERALAASRPNSGSSRMALA